jgi:hypothetical protein
VLPSGRRTFGHKDAQYTKFGAVRTGIRSFQRDLPLPTIEFGPQGAGLATRFEWKSVVAVADGMTFGGPVRPPAAPGIVPVQTAVTAFGRPRGTVYAARAVCHGSVIGVTYAPRDQPVTRTSRTCQIESVAKACSASATRWSAARSCPQQGRRRHTRAFEAHERP